MAKRTRYPKRTNARPVAKRIGRTDVAASGPEVVRRPIDPDEALGIDDAMPIRSSSSLTEAEFERAEQLEAELVAKERADIAASLRTRARTEERAIGGPVDHNAPLSVRAAYEYAYVARDVKRIALTAALMVGILAVLYILTNVLGVITL